MVRYQRGLSKTSYAVITVGVIVIGWSTYFRVSPHSQKITNTPLELSHSDSTDIPQWRTPVIIKSATETNTETTSQNTLSLRGTTPDGELTLDATGLPTITPGMRRLFEYYLSTLGEQSLPAIRQQLFSHVQNTYSVRAAITATAYFDRYIDYRINLAEQQLELSNHGHSLTLTELLQYRMELLATVRQSTLSPEMSAAFFSEEQAYDQFMLDKLAIEQNTNLTPQEKEQQINTLLQSWPEFTQTNSLADQQNDIRQMITTARQNGAPESEIYEIRSAAFGYEAAERLSALDETRGQWQERLDQYAQQKQELLASGISPDNPAWTELRENSFSGPEARLVQALEKLQRL